jgi:hypothetical protein
MLLYLCVVRLWQKIISVIDWQKFAQSGHPEAGVETGRQAWQVQRETARTSGRRRRRRRGRAALEAGEAGT